MRQDKQLLLDEIKGQIDKYDTFLIMSYNALGANTANDFRTVIANLGGAVEVVRKRVFIKAAQEAGVALTLDVLPGHIGLVFVGKDPLETVKAAYKSSQENSKAIQMIGGMFEGQMYNAAQMEMLSKLPSRDEMRAELLSVFEAPMAQTLAVMEALLSSVVYCLDNKAKQDNAQ